MPTWLYPIVIPNMDALAGYAGLPTRLDVIMYTLERLEESMLINQAEVQGRLEKLEKVPGWMGKLGKDVDAVREANSKFAKYQYDQIEQIKKDVLTMKAAINLVATVQANHHKAQVYMQKTFKEKVEKINKAMTKILESHNK